MVDNNKLFRIIVQLFIFVWLDVNALGPNDPLLGRRDLLQGSHEAMLGLFTSAIIGSHTIEKNDGAEIDRISDAFQAKQIPWTAGDWGQLRYGTSSLLRDKDRIPVSSCKTLTPFPAWMEGYWLCTYKFDKADFPLGRDKLTLRTPGAGLGTCLALPNIGYNPAPFVQTIIGTSSSSDSNSNSAAYYYEDVAYNLPRRLEAFWPQAKVTSVQTSIEENDKGVLSPACLVTGEGCTPAENPNLHSPAATRFRMQLEVPTRRRSGGHLSQTIDLSLVANESTKSINNNRRSSFVASRSYVQYNVQQELPCFFKEFLSFSLSENTTHDQRRRILTGRTRVAAFVPQTDDTIVSRGYYDDSQAIALYDYTMEWKEIDSLEASTI